MNDGSTGEWCARGGVKHGVAFLTARMVNGGGDIWRVAVASRGRRRRRRARADGVAAS